MIAVEPLTAEAFASFGRILDVPAREPDNAGDPWRWWAETALVARAEGRYAVGYLEVENGRRGFDWAERHLESEEVVIPVRGELLLYAGPPDQGDAPSRDRFRIFRVRPGQAVILGKGVWHGAPLAAGGSATALVLLLEGTGQNDTQMAHFDEIPVEV
ncbi:MAG: ureidoglycolate lyase [Thermoleophilia bacterium]|nr:ureidoglycolate lyase [Thermoleophilia bacterium]